ncbi:hypothetical protein, partial [Nitrosomonas sp.]|uniref:hypothetical protein n=1 Tax=Nitrosomonas sp. TaxID=42353 RepID=UPI0032EA9200
MLFHFLRRNYDLLSFERLMTNRPLLYRMQRHVLFPERLSGLVGESCRYFLPLPVSLISLDVRIPSVVYSIQENTADEHTQTHSLNIIGSSGNLAALSNPA